MFLQFISIFISNKQFLLISDELHCHYNNHKNMSYFPMLCYIQYIIVSFVRLLWIQYIFWFKQ